MSFRHEIPLALLHRIFASAGNFARRGLGSSRRQHQPAGLGCAWRVALGGVAGRGRHLRSSLFRKSSSRSVAQEKSRRVERHTELESNGIGCDSRGDENAFDGTSPGTIQGDL